MIAVVRLYDMPVSIKSYVRKNADDSYTIVINSRLSREQQKICYRHEMEHINRMDFYGRKAVDALEKTLEDERMKKIIIVLLATIIMTATVNADETEDRIADLERRVAELERIVAELTGGSDAAEVVLPTGEPIELGTGTWIVGEDIPEGKYNLTCDSGYATVYFYPSLQSRQDEEYSFTEMYLIASDAFLESARSTYAEYSTEDAIDSLLSMYATTINNVYVYDGNCIYVENGSCTFVPAG